MFIPSILQSRQKLKGIPEPHVRTMKIKINPLSLSWPLILRKWHWRVSISSRCLQT